MSFVMNEKRILVATRQWFRFLNTVCGVVDRQAGTKTGMDCAHIRNVIRTEMEKISTGIMPSRRAKYSEIFGAYLLDTETFVVPVHILVSRAHTDLIRRTKLEIRYANLISNAEKAVIYNVYERMKAIGLFDVKMNGPTEIVIEFDLPCTKLEIPKMRKTIDPTVNEIKNMSSDELENQLNKIQNELRERKEEKAKQLVDAYVIERDKLINMNRDITGQLKQLGLYDFHSGSLNGYSL